MHRFFVPTQSIINDNVKMCGSVVHQIRNVFRARPGDQVILLDDSGWEYIVILEQVSASKILGKVTERLSSAEEANVEITLYQSVLKSERFEFVLQKATELGVANFVPVLCTRSIPQYTNDNRLESRYERWRKIISEAAEQSQRGKLPVLRPAVEFLGACNEVDGRAIIAWENEKEVGLKEVLTKWRRVNSKDRLNLFTGPEGGFTVEEVRLAYDKGIVPVSLGQRILRAETAAMTAVSAIMYEYGELGG